LAIGRHMIAWAQHNQITWFEVSYRNFSFAAVVIAAASNGGRQMQEFVQRRGSTLAGTRVYPMSKADQRNNRGRLHEIKMAGCAARHANPEIQAPGARCMS